MTKKYELLLVLPGTLDDKEAEARSSEVLGLVKEQDAEAAMQAMGKVRLAYPIKQIRYGYFYTLAFTVETSVIKPLQGKLCLMRDLLRAMITEYNEKFSVNQKMTYITTGTGANIAAQTEEAPVVEKKIEEKVSMQDIDKKLDEILSGDIIPGV